MFQLKPQVRFVLRGSTLLMVILTVWWWTLRPPMLFLLRVCESVALRLLANPDPARPLSEPVVVDAAGDWNFRVPVRDRAENRSAKPDRAMIRAIEFTMPQADVVLFTFSVPAYWAIVLAAWVGRSTVRTLAWGTALVALVEVLSLLVDAEMIAFGVTAQMHPGADALGRWFRDFGTIMVVNVIPFATPVLAAVALDRSLRSQIFPLQTPAARTKPIGLKKAFR